MPLVTTSKSSASWRKKPANGEQEIPLLDLVDGEEPFEDVSLSMPAQGSSSWLQTESASTPSTASSKRKASSSQMRSRSGRRDEVRSEQTGLNPAFVLVDIGIEEGDTLPSFAIKYHVTTSELKRLNNMFHEQDFHTRVSLKVPIHKYGILAERFLNLSHLQDSQSSSHDVLLDLSSDTNSPTLGLISETSNATDLQDDEVTQNITFRSMLNSQSRAAKLFLQNIDENLQRLRKEALERRPRSPIGQDDLLSSRYRIEALPAVGDGLGCDSADCGINLKALLCMILCLTIVLPAAFLIYKLYCLHHPHLCPNSLDHSLTNTSVLTLAHHHLH